MEPTLGRIVHYTLTDDDAEQINRRRIDAINANYTRPRDGAVVHVGNPTKGGDVFPAVIVRVSDHYINVKCFLDGSDDFWKPSLPPREGDGAPGSWVWPPRV